MPLFQGAEQHSVAQTWQKMAKRNGLYFLALLILLAVAGVAIFGWWALVYHNQDKTQEWGAFNVPGAPYRDGSETGTSASRTDLESSGRLEPVFLDDISQFIEDKQQKRPAPAARVSRAAAPAPVTTAERSENAAVTKAKRFYYNLKNNPRFRNSRALHQWNREFLSHGDLHKINAKYQKDRDAAAFVIAVLQSPNFMNLAAKYLFEPDIQEFAGQMMGAKEVTASIEASGNEALVKQSLAQLRLLKAEGSSKNAQVPR